MRRGEDTAPYRSRGSRGISLIECLVYLAVIGVIISVGGFTLARAWDESRAIQRNADEIARAVRAGERWRADVRQASGPITVRPEAEGQQARIPTAKGDVIYRFAVDTIRMQARPDAPEVTLVSRVKHSSMAAERRAGVSTWRWELELQPAQKKPRLRPLFTFEAVPGKENL